MTAPCVILCNYTEAEEKAWRFLLRGFPMLQVISVPSTQFGETLDSVVSGGKAQEHGEAPGFTERMAVFAGAQGELLKLLIDLSRQVTREKAHRAVMTDTNAAWTLNDLFSQLEEEEQTILAAQKKTKKK